MKSANGPSESELHARLNAFLQADAESEAASDHTIRIEAQRFTARVPAGTSGGPVRSAEQHSAEQRATPRQPPAAWDADQPMPVSYGLFARLADGWAGRADGRRGIPAIPPGSPAAADPLAVITPRLMVLTHHFLELSEHERQRSLIDTQPLLRQRVALLRLLAQAVEELDRVSDYLGGMPEFPAEAALVRRSAREWDADETWVRTRREREHRAQRDRAQAQVRLASERVRELQAEEAEITEMITTSRLVLATRVRRLHSHTLRRSATYLQHLVRRHPHGADLILFLHPALPGLPSWLTQLDADAEPPELDAAYPSPLAAD